ANVAREKTHRFIAALFHRAHGVSRECRGVERQPPSIVHQSSNRRAITRPRLAQIRWFEPHAEEGVAWNQKEDRIQAHALKARRPEECQIEAGPALFFENLLRKEHLLRNRHVAIIEKLRMLKARRGV